MQVPSASNPQTQAFARALRAEVASDSAYIDAVLQRFHQENYFYTLEPPPLGSDPVDRFLFDTRRGFCEHYASAFAVLMRSAGIPARVVLGYHGGEINPLGGHLIVRQSDAHAWNEIWLPETGWSRVDPTAAVAPERIESGLSGALGDGVAVAWGLSVPSAWMHRVTLTWDALNAKWNEWILGYGPENQTRFMRWLGMEHPAWREMLLSMIALIAILMAAISVLLLLRNRPPASDRAALLYKRFVRKSGITPHVGETPAAFAERVRDAAKLSPDSIDSVTANYLDARYGPLDAAALRRLEFAVRSLRS